MKLVKKVVRLTGIPLLPVAAGSRAVLLSGGRVIWTSRVVAVHANTEEELRFETLNTHYRVALRPFPQADAAAIPMQMAA